MKSQKTLTNMGGFKIKKLTKIGKKIEKKVVRPTFKPIDKFGKSCEKRGVTVGAGTGSEGNYAYAEHPNASVHTDNNGTNVEVHN